ncbi:hypothetical protein [Demequina activiva]|uniref:Uncharacterized protein n=1 Tax=Demequina activiva TaxID=1582364 RepID=A0A919UFS2_9MICO|nr:hypothetical protein [Demequina activiva]GIG53739.1 hypothetical protein Dac01nite_04910 [Demequina activiva]
MDQSRQQEADSAALWGPDAKPQRAVDDERRVADCVQELYPSCPDGVIRAAILWPAVRHGAVRVGDLTRGGPGERMVQTLEALERAPQESEESYYGRVRSNPWALMVAHADIVVAGDPARLRTLEPHEREDEIARIDRARRELGLDD